MTSKYLSLAIFVAQIIAISCKRYGSLALVIDDTYSMYYEIDSVKRESNKFMDVILTQNSTQISDVVIVTFNDPEKSNLRLKSTRDRTKVKKALDEISVHRGGDCPEYSLAGINTALQNSLQNSYLFVFTDASPKDRSSSAEVIKRAQSKESQIFFFLTKPSCRWSHYKPYWDIAKATNGQVFKINDTKDLQQFLNYMNDIISGEGNVIKRVDIPAKTTVSIPFTVDKQTEYVRVSASTQGDELYLDLTSGPTREYKKMAWTQNNKVLIIRDPAPGDYSVSVRGSDATTIMIVGRTDFTFQHGFSENIPPTFSNEKSQPIEGIKSHLLVKVYDPTSTVDIKTVQISSPDEKTIYFPSLELKKVSDDYYATNSFLAPNALFVITVIGEGKKTGVPIKRTAKTPIQPRPQNMDPVISIQGGGKYEYNTDVLLTCNVNAYPKPKNILWMDSKEMILPAATPLQKNGEKDFVSSLRLKNLKHKTELYCSAENDHGDIFKKRVDLDINTPFKKQFEDTKNATAGEDIKISCGIEMRNGSRFPLRITWYRETGEVVQTSDRYLITENGAFLTIRNIGMDTRGKYTCKASIVGDETTIETHDTTVDITLEKPAVEIKHRVLEVFRYQTARLKCKVLKGLPRPTITWMVKYERSNKFVALPQVGEELEVTPALYHHAGLYKCILKNKIGSDEGTVRLLVKGPPEILTSSDILYTALVGDDFLVIPCDVAGYPKPNITWSSEFNIKTKLNVNSNGALVIKNPTTDDSDIKYVCTATNEFGQANKTFDTYVEQKIGDYPQQMGDIKDVIVIKDTIKKIPCGSGSLKGRWYKNGNPMGITGTLTVNSVLRSYDDGSVYHGTNYTCRINDINGSRSYTYNVKIEHKPILKEPNDKSIDWNGNEIILSCDAFMRPEHDTAQAKWYYNGKESYQSRGTAHLSKHPIISWGNYTCNISNHHGYVIKHFYVYSSKCLINTKLKGMKYPLILDKLGFWPETDQDYNYLVVDSSEDLLLSCNNHPTQPNFFQKVPGETEIIATCDHEDKLMINGTVFNILDLQCNTNVAPIIKETGKKCFTENTELLKVGYDVQKPEPSFIEVYSVCFDKSEKVPIYSKSIVTQEDSGRIENPVWLKYDNYYKENVEKLYCTKDTKCCINKKQLVNEVDMENGPMKLATYIDGLNSIPYWHNCSTVDYTWSDLDLVLRNFYLETPYTKMSGALSYSSKNGVMVPKYLWKFVNDNFMSSLFVIVVVNDPSPTAEDIRCTYSCPWPEWTPGSKYTFCCDVNEFTKAFNLSILDAERI